MTIFSPSVSIHVTKKAISDQPPAQDWLLLGDESLAENGYTSRTAQGPPEFKNPCTPSVVRYYQEMREKQGDFRVNISPMLGAFLRLNGEDSIRDPKARYFFGERTAMFNNTGYPKQAYITMQGNRLRGVQIGQWLKFETLTPSSNVTYKDTDGITKPMSYATHPHLIHRFDLVCYKNELTYHKQATPQGVIFYYLTTNEGYAYIPLRYVKPI